MAAAPGREREGAPDGEDGEREAGKGEGGREKKLKKILSCGSHLMLVGIEVGYRG